MNDNGTVQHTLDAAVLAGFPLAVFAGILPPIAAFISIVYGCIKIYESKTFQSFLKHFNTKGKK